MPNAKTKLGEARYYARLRAIKRLAEEFDIKPDNNSTAGEDLQEFRNEKRPYKFNRYCVVTEGNSGIYYLYPDFSSLADAKATGVRYMNDSLYSETPIKIVNLDTGEEWRPQFNKIVWKKEE